MVNYEVSTLDQTFAALADPTRRAIVARLARGEASVTELAAPFEISLPAISKHLRVLEQAGLLARRKEGRVHYCRLTPGPLQNAAEWLSFHRQLWETSLDALAGYLAGTSQKDEVTNDRSDSESPHDSPDAAHGRCPA